MLRRRVGLSIFLISHFTSHKFFGEGRVKVGPAFSVCSSSSERRGRFQKKETRLMRWWRSMRPRSKSAPRPERRGHLGAHGFCEPFLGGWEWRRGHDPRRFRGAQARRRHSHTSLACILQPRLLPARGMPPRPWWRSPAPVARGLRPRKLMCYALPAKPRKSSPLPPARPTFALTARRPPVTV